MLPIHDENRPAIKPYVNYGLLFLNVAVFFFFFLQGIRTLKTSILNLGAVPSAILEGKELWTLFTSMFMHADPVHLFGNMIYLWVFGDNIEDALGHGRYLVFYLLGGFVASFTHIASLFVALPALSPVGLSVPSVGASGAISAVLGAYLLLYPRAKIRTVVFYIFITVITIPAFYYLGFWFLYQLMMGFLSLTELSSGIAFWAHIGGFVAGFILVKVLGGRARGKQDVILSREPVRPLYVSPRVRTPFVDVMVEEDRVRVLAELPGVDEDDIIVRASDWELIISAEHEELRYYKRVGLPFRVSPKVQEYSFRNGVLSFALSKRA
ncbi:rhomboid family intramembrane serine protease [Candidatus Bathyarchaeota archaeon]|nr:rhomboid family intramembrane serine protease [Candidatus Bathyarchaeota archaeon]NIU81559.1 rhomboid family intramembrane serine protease [Candidatus Bathyarchaeota archaeon]NIV68195.1 rhomboid family intramembrane serine protease [Candidatus Bathyarchaeota archaeon]NIW16577.1 rhomboid family intramembrane serine protease [Candidatus Bathyarchaeota archaeon]NIW34796.1 rhomboid family intramembrane serine protease [Candidatus Bathyarchaeota archaeon]